MGKTQVFHEFEGLGTAWKIHIADSLPNEAVAEVYKSVAEIVRVFEDDYSRFKPTSWIGRLNTVGSIDDPPPELIDMLLFATSCAEITDNHFNIAVGARLEDIGYDQTYSLKRKEIIRQISPLRNVLTVDKSSIRLTKDSSIDLGGFGKGWLIDKLAKYLNERGINQAVVDGGGDILITNNGLKGRPIPLEDPHSNNRIIGEINIQAGAVASSSPKHRTWPDIKSGGELHHLVNPKANEPLKEIAAVYTHASSATNADTASTCLFVSPASLHHKIAKRFNASYCIVYADGRFYASRNYPGKIFSKN